MIDPWALIVLLLVNAAVAWIVGALAANSRYATLAWKVAEMEAAVTHYWDRIRKRVRVEPYEAAPVRETTTDPFAEIRRQHSMNNPLEVPHEGSRGPTRLTG